jgi:cytochrome c oxidase accessory protein FixG
MNDFATPVKDETFRDHIATVSKDGKRNWIYAQKPKGKLYTARSIVSIVYLILFFGLPFVRVHDTPFFLFNILERKFIFFGVTFWPQDFFIFGIGMLAFIVFIVLFTVVFGRTFCGWACPQTIFMEMVFRKIEYWIEGDAAHQKMLNRSKWTSQKIAKKTFKHFVFFLMAFIIANTFLAYIIGTDELFSIINEPLSEHIGGLISLFVFTGMFYGVYAWFREQVCLIVCPYGRLQGVMTDKNSILVAYDYLRGEPRGKYKKERSDKGDCIDCNQCVNVCPTGIDIRNGTQLECVSCTACIDACDFMMTKIGKPEGLIRYASENNISKREKTRFTPRILAYSCVLLAIIGVFVVLLVTRKDVGVTIQRTPGMLFQKQENNMISNLYNIRLINKTQNEMPLMLKLESETGRIQMVGKNIIVGKESKAESEFFVFLPKDKIVNRKTELLIGIYSGDKRIETIRTTFLGPVTIKK